MASSDDWRELARDFRSLAAENDKNWLWAAWSCVVNVSATDTWKVEGKDSFTARFKALASRTARLLNPDATNLVDTWLRFIRDKKPDSLETMDSSGVVRFDGQEFDRRGGVLRNLCAASADLCSELESRAVEAEHRAALRERQRNDPGNWSPLRQQWEAFKGIRRTISSQQEEIPEHFVRQVIAQQDGVNPEDVTWERIQFEVSGLLRDYPAIRLIRSERVQGDVPLAPPHSQQTRSSPKALKEAYISAFPDIVILDICWAAKQRYHEWIRWIGGKLKDGCKPDRAFRALLTSGKRPQEYRTEPRPKGWK